MTGSFHEQVSVVSHEAFYLLNGGTLQPGGGWIPSSRAGEQGQLQPVPGSDAGSSRGTIAFSAPNHPQGPSSQLPPFIRWVPNPCVLHPLQPAKAKQTRSWFVIPAWIIPCKQVGMI